MSTRYHQAAADGNLELLKEATRKDLNSSDVDGMTPAQVVAYHGNLEALEIICRRGGDPDKCDIWGNTPLHHAASNGHAHCISFLINFGANVFALDNDMHSPLDVAASRNQFECVRILDNAATEKQVKNPKRVSRLKAQAQRDAERQIRECERRQQKHEHEMARSFQGGSVHSAKGTGRKAKVSNFFTPGSLNALPKHLKDTFKLKAKKKEESLHSQGAGSTGQGKDSAAGRMAVMDVFHEKDEEELTNHFKKGARFSNDDDDDDELAQRSIFNRPGLGNLVFRSNLSTGQSTDAVFPGKEGGTVKIPEELFQLKEPETVGDQEEENNLEESWIEEEIGWDDDNTETTPLEVFLASQNLNEFLPILMSENIDLEALMLCSDDDLRSIQIQLGPRKKILHAIGRRKQVLASPGKAEDTEL
ncbi:Ankyrin repeat and SAM domain-containing protein 4B [Varanus komodoensis]|uniref:Ankyrin repeat and sterile alpha motif domain containing 4B n=1 Tax=Varanus komodoensis TaxID=61221 RepID=A0A8D2J4V1_VARKO|nr:ankyrin repeat and SAM domain-containing protein 4B [Varanus komodoensis]KAF7242942.1 Ankyrin repeat and SAM domain-containing protein 4B [Varanus komodoensis]